MEDYEFNLKRIELEQTATMALASACWVMYGAIVQAWTTDQYNEALASLHAIGVDAMIRAGLIEKPDTPPLGQ